jgi:ADP-heptose:LPS heptosyltransferase
MEINILKCSIQPNNIDFDSPELGEVKNILLTKLDHIGDLVTSLPAIHLTRRKFPDARITLLVGTWNMSIAGRVAGIDEVMTFDYFSRKSEEGIKPQTTEELNKLRSTLLDRKFDLAIDLRRHPETRPILVLSGAKYKVGYLTGKEMLDSNLYISLIPPNEFHDKFVPHISTQAFNLVNVIGKDRFTDFLLPEIRFTKQEVDKINKKYAEVIRKPLLVGINPGVGSMVRQWPNSHYIELINTFIEKDNAHIILFGSPGEAKLVQDVYEQVKNKDNVTNLAGQLSIGNCMLLTKYCHLFIGNNSGSGHIAGLLNVPTLIVFSGQVTPSEWHPFGEHTYLLRADIDCAPCFIGYRQFCKRNLDCLKLIKPETVYQEGGKILERNVTTQA